MRKVRENVPLLHNMSAPPKSVVKYAGLADMTTAASPIGRAGAGVFGTPIRFALPSEASRTVAENSPERTWKFKRK